MKYTYCLFFICFITCNLNAQITFNKIDDFPFLSSLARSIIQKDSCFFASGTYTDENEEGEIIKGSYLQKLNRIGELEDLYLFVDSTGLKTFEHFRNSLNLDQHGNFLISGYSRQGSDPIAPYILKFNDEGKILFQSFLPGFDGGNFNLDGDFVVLEDGNIIAATNCEWPEESTQICLFKIDGLRGSKIWEKQIVDTDFRHFTGDIQIGPNGNVFLFGNKDKGHIDWVPLSSAQIIEIDTSGEIISQWLSNPEDSLWRSHSGLVEEDASLIITTSKVIKYFESPFAPLLYDPVVMKLDSTYNEVWRYDEIGRTDTLFSPSLKTSKIIKDKFSNAYLFIGRTHRADGNNQTNPTDKFGSLTKLDESGQKIYKRLYQFYDDIGSDDHIFTDFVQLDDGSLVICGEAINAGDSNEFRQSSWFVRLDKHGCLVPGCHEPVGTNEVENHAEIKLTCYPNPSSENVYVHINAQSHGELHLNHINGQSIDVYPIRVNDLSLSINIQHLPMGLYVFTYVSEHGEFVSTKFLKE